METSNLRRQRFLRLEPAVLAFAALFPGAVTFVYFVLFPGQTVTTILYATNKMMHVVLPACWMILVLKNSAPLRRPGWKDVRSGLLSGFGIMALMLIMYYAWARNSPMIESAPDRIYAKLGELGAATPLRFMVFGSFLMLVNSGLEEFYWRWFIFGRLRAHMPAAAAAAFSSVAFSIHHGVILSTFLSPEYALRMALFFSVFVAAGGGIWAWMFHRENSIVAIWISHLLADLPLIVVGVDLLSGYW